MEFGLPVEDAKAVCEEKYAKEVVKLTIQIVDPNIKVIEKDVSATFNDKLGVVGTYRVRQKSFSQFACYRVLAAYNYGTGVRVHATYRTNFFWGLCILRDRNNILLNNLNLN